MEKQSSFSELLYIGEHLNCHRYLKEVHAGFIYREFNAGTEEVQKDIRHNHLLMFLEGECTVTCNQFVHRKFRAGDMILIPFRSVFTWRIDTRLKMLDMVFETLANSCEKHILQDLSPLRSQIDYRFRPVRMRPPLTRFATSLIGYFNDGIQCSHLHEIKHQEFLMLLRWYYTREEIVELFYPLVGTSQNFRAMIYRILPEANSLNEMVAIAGMSRTWFMRKFKAEFGTTAHQWMLKQVCQKIIAETSIPDITIKEIMVRYGFSSHSNFNRFCRKNLGCSPTELIRKYRHAPE